MIIRRSNDRHGNIYPAGLNALASIPDHLSFHLTHQRRHPKSAYSTSLRLITTQWIKVLDEYDKLMFEHNFENKHSNESVLLSEYSQLLFRLNEHLDACIAALRSLCPEAPGKWNEFDAHILTKAKLPGWKAFQEAIKPYRVDLIGCIVNTLKHKQGELCSIHFKSLMEFRPGYFLRDVLPTGALGPSHILHSNGNTAFSYSRDMMMHMWWLFRIGELLAQAVQTAVEVKHAHILSEESVDFGDKDWVELVNRCAALRPEFFPDEIPKPYPRILLQRFPCQVTIEFPTSARGHQLPHGMTISTSMTIDMAHPTNKIPYFSHLS
jgi:hypothetical protein